MTEAIELRRVRAGVAGPDGLVIVAVTPKSPSDHRAEFWYVPLNTQLDPLTQTITMSDMPVELALSVMRDTGIGELDRAYAARYAQRFPDMTVPLLDNEVVEWDLLCQLWLRNLTGTHLESIQATTKSHELASRLRAVTSLARPTLDAF